MAQYYQLVGQGDQPIQAVTIEELRQYYPNITCVEAGNGVQYVINQEESAAQFQSQQIVLNSGDATQQAIVDQSQMSFTQTQGYMKQEGDLVEYQAGTELGHPAGPPQVYYAAGSEVAKQPEPQLVNHIIQDQRQIVNQQLIASQRVVTQHVITDQVGHMMTQVNNSHMIQQRRVSVNQNHQQTTPPRQQMQQETQYQPVLQSEQNEADNNQLIRTTDGRIMTLTQLKDELSLDKKTPTVRKRAPPKPRANTGRGRGGRARGGQPNNRSPQMPTPAKPFNHVQNSNSPQKPIVQYTNKHVQHNQQMLQQPQVNQQVGPQVAQQVTQQVVTQQVVTQQVVTQQVAQRQVLQQKIPNAQQPNAQLQIGQNVQRQVAQQVPRLLQQQHMMQQQFQSQAQQIRRQQPIPLTPGFNGAIQKGPYSPPNQVHQLLDDSCSSSLSDEYKDSAKMLVCLENGEQRLITFTLPKESCTVQDLLEQVGVPFNNDTNIDCVTNTGMCDIDYIVSVGAVSQPANSFIETQQALTVDNLSESQECIVSQSGAVIPVPEVAPLETPRSPEKPAPEPVREVARLMPGFLALCSHCGYLSEDFNRCQRCRTKLPDDPKAVPSATNVAKQQAEHSKKIEMSKKIVAVPSLTRFTPKLNNIKPIVKPGRKKKLPEIEPVILTLSSDEEDTPAKVSVSISSQMSSRILDSAISLSALQKEPVYPDNIPGICDDDDFITSSGNNSSFEEKGIQTSTTLPCRTIRIGTYKFVPREEVVITNFGLKIITPLILDPTKSCALFIPMKYILKVLVNFHKSLPVLFFYVLPSVGNAIRRTLKMEAGSDTYFDPLSKEDPFKRITLLPDVIFEETKTAILEIYSTKYNPYSLVEELTTKEANDILIRTCPKESIKKEVFVSNEPKQLLIYPPPPAKGGITINVEDFMCLGQDQFLNDAIIDFYLKYLQIEVLAPPMQNRVHMFSSFFYKRLTTKPVKASKRLNPFEIDPSLTPAQKRHCRVKKWTKNVNIFDKDFIIIPINENSHWFLAIVCFPGLEGCRAINDDSKVIKLPPKEKKKNQSKDIKSPTSVVIGNTTITLESKKAVAGSSVLDKPIKCDEEEMSDRDEAEGDESELEESESEVEPEPEGLNQPKLLKPSAKNREPIKQPCILIFDSLAGAGRSRVVATLRDYLTCEHRAKLSSTKTFNKDNIKGACPKVPQQMNFTDCGLYVLQYVEAFFRKPITDYHIPIKELKNWFKEIVVTRKREEISFLIRDLMGEMKRDVSYIPDLTFPTNNGKLITASAAEGMEDPGTDEEDEEKTTPEFPSSSLVSDMYNSEESDECKQTETASSDSSGMVSVQTSAGALVVTDSDTVIKPDHNEIPKKSNRETMSYLKSKRIQRHKNNDSFEPSKKQKVSE